MAVRGFFAAAQKQETLEFWSDPVPSYDVGLALVGRRIKCAFSKSAVMDHPGARRVVEGVVVGLLDQAKVELLIEKSATEEIPF